MFSFPRLCKVPKLAADGTDIQLKEVFLEEQQELEQPACQDWHPLPGAQEGTVDITDKGEVVGAACTILFFWVFPGTPAEILSIIALKIFFGWHVTDQIAAIQAAVKQWHQDQDKAERNVSLPGSQGG